MLLKLRLLPPNFPLPSSPLPQPLQLCTSKKAARERNELRGHRRMLQESKHGIVSGLSHQGHFPQDSLSFASQYQLTPTGDSRVASKNYRTPSCSATGPTVSLFVTPYSDALSEQLYSSHVLYLSVHPCFLTRRVYTGGVRHW